METLPLIHPDRTDANSFRPIKALHHFRKLVANKEDTEQVFHIIKALSGKDFIRRAEAFWQSPRGEGMTDEKVSLVSRLDDHATLRKNPVGSVAQAYCDFMEAEGLTAQGLVDEYAKFANSKADLDDQLQRYSDRLRDTHDLFHVLTGYGRDPLGEQALLAFSYSQHGNLGILFIAYAAGRELKKDVPRAVPVYSAIREGQRLGKAAQQIAHADIDALLKLPLEEARRKLDIMPPTIYQRSLDMIRDGGLNPYDLLKPAAA